MIWSACSKSSDPEARKKRGEGSARPRPGGGGARGVSGARGGDRLPRGGRRRPRHGSGYFFFEAPFFLAGRFRFAGPAARFFSISATACSMVISAGSEMPRGRETFT